MRLCVLLLPWCPISKTRESFNVRNHSSSETISFFRVEITFIKVQSLNTCSVINRKNSLFASQVKWFRQYITEFNTFWQLISTILSHLACVQCSCHQGLNADKTTTELWPPKPNELEIAAARSQLNKPSEAQEHMQKRGKTPLGGECTYRHLLHVVASHSGQCRIQLRARDSAFRNHRDGFTSHFLVLVHCKR